ncbi:hypothetical protein [Labrenzia sp. VG12]|uniref:hypothetical protein n=1 Tax=Labrenzia sp. VG12 TaxID=2021862 RepID=UPI0012FD12AC|nr:hypothetical protein [Labrenzia sp. VG12]
MPVSTRLACPDSSGLKARLRVVATLSAALLMAGCQSQFQQPSDLLFAPTFSKTRQNIPYTYNTPYDCRTFTGSGWKGIASGKVNNFDQTYLISQAGCFKTQQECEAWIFYMRGYIDIPRFMRCNTYTA